MMPPSEQMPPQMGGMPPQAQGMPQAPQGAGNPMGEPPMHMMPNGEMMQGEAMPGAQPAQPTIDPMQMQQLQAAMMRGPENAPGMPVGPPTGTPPPGMPPPGGHMGGAMPPMGM